MIKVTIEDEATRRVCEAIIWSEAETVAWHDGKLEDVFSDVVSALIGRQDCGGGPDDFRAEIDAKLDRLQELRGGADLVRRAGVGETLEIPVSVNHASEILTVHLIPAIQEYGDPSAYPDDGFWGALPEARQVLMECRDAGVRMLAELPTVEVVA